jgi:hypothetical protein
MPIDREFIQAMEETARNLARQSRALRAKSKDMAKDAARIRKASAKARKLLGKKKEHVARACNRNLRYALFVEAVC